MPEARSAASATLLAFDFGERRIGVAVGETATAQAHAIACIDAEANAQRFAEIARLIDTWRPLRLVVGVPCHVDGTPHAMTVRCRRFANQLRGRFGLPVDEADERLTSVDAEHRLRDAGVEARKQRGLSDALAAQLILQGYLDERRAA